MKKKITILLFVILNILNCSESMNEEYMTIKMTNDTNKIDEYYYENILKNENMICTEIEKKYSQSIDHVADYISGLNADELTGVKCAEEIILKDYFIDGILEQDELHKKEYSEKLEKLYNKSYEKTENVEILGYSLNSKPILDKIIYERLLEKSVKKKSWYGIRTLKFEEVKRNKEYLLFLNRYEIKQKKIIGIKDTEFIDIMLCIDNEDSTLNFCIRNKEKNYIEKISEYSDIDTSGYYLSVLDLNNDKNLEIIVENDDNIYVYSLKNDKLNKIFDGIKDINLKNYYKFEVLKKEMKVIITDDFGYKKVKKFKLPNIKELISHDNSTENNQRYKEFFFIDNKLWLRIPGEQIYEIIFDKNLNFKLRFIDNKKMKIPLGYSVI